MNGVYWEGFEASAKKKNLKDKPKGYSWFDL
jgi:hypothetical protein